MPILDLQKSLRRLGKIRMGDQRPSSGGKLRPAKLTEWRVTSPSLELVQQVAAIYGGTPEVWEGSPSEGREYQVYTESDTLRVVVPGDFTFSQWREMWSAGGCQRRCDGRTEQLTDQPCVCPADVDERANLAKSGKACKDTTRLSVLLPDVPDIGVWMLESHGYYAAVELAGAIDVIGAANGRMIPAQLRIDQRTVKRGNETRRYAVPVLELTTVTPAMLMTGQATPVAISAPVGPVAEIGTGGRAAESAAAVAPAPTAKPAPRAVPAAAPAAGGTDWMARINAIADAKEKKACMDAFKDAFGTPPFAGADADVAERILGAFEPRDAGGTHPPLPGEDDTPNPDEVARRRKALMAVTTKAFPCDELTGKAKTERRDLLRHAAIYCVVGEHRSTMQMTADELRRVEFFVASVYDDASVTKPTFEVLDGDVVRVTFNGQTVEIAPIGAEAAA